jgi:hypothetical protein
MKKATILFVVRITWIAFVHEGVELNKKKLDMV